MPEPDEPTIPEGGEPTTPPTGEPTPAEPTEEKVTLTKAEYDAQQTKLADYRRKEKKAQDAAAEAERKRLQDAGEHQQLAEQAQAKADAAEQALADLLTTQRIADEARTLKFRDSKVALALLPAGLDREDPEATTRALEAIAAQNAYLIDDGTPGRTGGPAGGGGRQLSLQEQIADAEGKGDLKLARALKARLVVANQTT